MMKSSLRPFQTDDARLRAVHDKVLSGNVLDREDVTALYTSKDILAIGWLANFVRERMHGNSTNCAVNTVLADAAASNAAEVIVLGTSYEETLQTVTQAHREHPHARISALTVEELAAQPNPTDTARRLRESGVHSLIGEGAEVFIPSVRQRLWRARTSWQRRAEAREAAFQAGLHVPLYMIERGASPGEQAAELLSLAGWKIDSFAILTFDPSETTTVSAPMTTGMQEMKHVAIARLALLKAEHIRVYWQTLGGKLAQISLRFGASEVDGTALDPNVNPEFRRREVSREISVAGREPKEIPAVRKIVLGR